MWLVEELLTDPSSHLSAAYFGWDYPVTREWIVIADHLDFVASANKKNKPRSRPWDVKRKGKTNLPPADAKAALALNAGRG